MMANLRIIFVDGREDLVVPYPDEIEYLLANGYCLGHYWIMFQHLSELLRVKCIHQDEIKDVVEEAA